MRERAPTTHVPAPLAPLALTPLASRPPTTHVPAPLAPLALTPLASRPPTTHVPAPECVQLDAVFSAVMRNSLHVLSTERTTLWLYDADKRELWTRASCAAPGVDAAEPDSGGNDRRDALKLVRLDVDDTSVAGACALHKKSIVVPHAYADPRFNAKVDRRTGLRTESILVTPVLDKTGGLVGVLQCINKRLPHAHNDAERPFGEEDVRIAEMLSLHISMFIDALD